MPGAPAHYSMVESAAAHPLQARWSYQFSREASMSFPRLTQKGSACLNLAQKVAQPAACPVVPPPLSDRSKCLKSAQMATLWATLLQCMCCRVHSVLWDLCSKAGSVLVAGLTTRVFVCASLSHASISSPSFAVCVTSKDTVTLWLLLLKAGWKPQRILENRNPAAEFMRL